MASARARSLREELADIAVRAGGIDTHGDACVARARGVAGEHAGDHAPRAVELGGTLVDAADPRAGATADQRQAQGPAELLA